MNKTHRYKTLDPLIDVCESITDCHHSTPDWTDRGKLVIRNFNIKNGTLSLNEPSFTNESDFNKRISRAVPESGDLIISREAPMGDVCIIPEGLECCLGQRLVLLKPDRKEINNKYLLYAMLSEFVQKQIFKSDFTGSIVSNLCIPDLEQLKIPRFNQTEEIAIGEFLSFIDQKIELNNKINKELESLARTIYNYWFVQFDFPISAAQAMAMGQPQLEEKPYRVSGGPMEYHEVLKREVPKGWKVKNLEQVSTKLNSGGTPSTQNREYYNGTIPWYSTQELQDKFLISSISHITEEAIKESSAKLFPAGTIVIAIYASPTVGRLGILSTEGAFNQACCGIVADEFVASKEFIFISLLSIRRYLNTIATGTAQKNLNVEKIKNLDLLLPDVDVNRKFSTTIKPIFKLIEKKQIENQELIRLRDFLLPLLMNGQVRVK